MALENLRDLYVQELKDVYSAEKQLIRALPKMAKKARSETLQQAFEQHLEQTREHVGRLEQIFGMLDMKPRSETCKGMQGVVSEGEEVMEKKMAEEVMDAALIASAQKAEHYEIASYGTLRTYAQMLGEEDQAELLEQTLDEEKETDQKLTELAESSINQDAAG